MPKFENEKFSVYMNQSKAYEEGYDRIFKKNKESQNEKTDKKEKKSD